MDQDAFRQTYREINERDCVFEKAVLTNQCGCRHAERFCIAEREGLACHSAEGRARCAAWLELVREQARFAFKTAGSERPALGHGKAIAAQVGGLRGLRRVLRPDESAPAAVIADVDGLLREALGRFGRFERVPMQAVIQQVAAYKIKKRARRRR